MHAHSVLKRITAPLLSQLDSLFLQSRRVDLRCSQPFRMQTLLPFRGL
jgi:hypothetical protein